MKCFHRTKQGHLVVVDYVAPLCDFLLLRLRLSRFDLAALAAEIISLFLSLSYAAPFSSKAAQELEPAAAHRWWPKIWVVLSYLGWAGLGQDRGFSPPPSLSSPLLLVLGRGRGAHCEWPSSPPLSCTTWLLICTPKESDLLC